MTIELRYGSKNKKGKMPSQNIFIRVRHNSTYDYIRTLKIPVQEKDWNFRKHEINFINGFNTQEYNKKLKEVSDRVNSIYSYMSIKANDFHFTTGIETLTGKEWIEICDKWLREYKEPLKQSLQPKIADLMKTCGEAKAIKKHSGGTPRAWKTNELYYEAFEKAHRQYRTDELDSVWYSKLITWLRNEYPHLQTDKKGLKENSVVKCFKQLRATANYYKRKYNFDSDIFDTDITEASYIEVDFEVFHKDELKLLWEYSAENKTEENVLWYCKVLYYGAFRFGDAKMNLQDKTPKEIFKQMSFIKGHWVWKCKQQKAKGLDSYKQLPMYDSLITLLLGGKECIASRSFPVSFPKIYSDTHFSRALKLILAKLGIQKHITTHSFRRTFCTDRYKENKSYKDIKQFTGHKTEEMVKTYIKNAEDFTGTEIDTKQ